MHKTESDILNQLEPFVEEEKAAIYPKFFQAFPGGYGEGDKFIGVRVPHRRAIAKENRFMSLEDLSILLKSDYHEVRSLALYILTWRYTKCKIQEEREEFVNFYLRHSAYINNWDLVDCSAPYILGDYFLRYGQERQLKLITSSVMWEQRMAIVSCLYFIRKKKLSPVYPVITPLLLHSHDLIHKAIGWVLRELGKKDPDALRVYLKDHYDQLARTTLRYAIEKFSAEERQQWLTKAF